jgi:hypothetical protein
LRSRKDKILEKKGVVEGRSALDTGHTHGARRKCHISLAKSKASREVKEGKQITIVGALRAGKSQGW